MRGGRWRGAGEKGRRAPWRGSGAAPPPPPHPVHVAPQPPRAVVTAPGIPPGFINGRDDITRTTTPPPPGLGHAPSAFLKGQRHATRREVRGYGGAHAKPPPRVHPGGITEPHVGYGSWLLGCRPQSLLTLRVRGHSPPKLGHWSHGTVEGGGGLCSHAVLWADTVLVCFSLACAQPRTPVAFTLSPVTAHSGQFRMGATHPHPPAPGHHGSEFGNADPMHTGDCQGSVSPRCYSVMTLRRTHPFVTPNRPRRNVGRQEWPETRVPSTLGQQCCKSPCKADPAVFPCSGEPCSCPSCCASVSPLLPRGSSGLHSLMLVVLPSMLKI